MKASAEETQEYLNPQASDAPRYPWGLEITLCDDSLEKLGYASPPPVGTVLMVTARVEVTSSSQRQMQGGDAESSSCWQITDMEVTSGQTNTDASTLYPNSKMS